MQPHTHKTTYLRRTISRSFYREGFCRSRKNEEKKWLNRSRMLHQSNTSAESSEKEVQDWVGNLFFYFSHVFSLSPRILVFLFFLLLCARLSPRGYRRRGFCYGSFTFMLTRTLGANYGYDGIASSHFSPLVIFFCPENYSKNSKDSR